MLRGEIDVQAVMYRADRIRDWLKKQRLVMEYWALKAWNKAGHPPDNEAPAITLANKLTVAHLYGKTLELALLRRKRMWERRSAYAKAIRQATTDKERQEARELLEG